MRGKTISLNRQPRATVPSEWMTKGGMAGGLAWRTDSPSHGDASPAPWPRLDTGLGWVFWRRPEGGRTVPRLPRAQQPRPRVRLYLAPILACAACAWLGRGCTAPCHIQQWGSSAQPNGEVNFIAPSGASRRTATRVRLGGKVGEGVTRRWLLSFLVLAAQQPGGGRGRGRCARTGEVRKGAHPRWCSGLSGWWLSAGGGG